MSKLNLDKHTMTYLQQNYGMIGDYETRQKLQIKDIHKTV